MRLYEMEMGAIKVDGYLLTQEEELEEDNRKIFHYGTPPGGKMTHIDHTPYEWLSRDMFQVYVDFHKAFGRFPSRRDIDSNAPIHRGEELDSLQQKAEQQRAALKRDEYPGPMPS